MKTEEYGTKEMERDYGVLTFGSAIWSHRKCEDITQKEFAMSLGISPQSLCDIEKGRKIPTPKRAAKIAKLIGHPEKYWIRLALQDTLRQANFNYKVSIA